ncbi:hypothetical protein GOBAR_AA29187 [Gossypium barbadense]|uniref:Uncharacterized protein n=1 Tax=Gossypium barbadense TaxID=3634 RepID=A0A2P5WK88_GOSBA|nr:hypothetical protein GOBAR_AA29187 [Gossypium barbadense]
MNELLELELWRIIGQGNDESGGGYSGGGRGSLVHKSCTKSILYLVVAMVVVEIKNFLGNIRKHNYS